MNSETIEAFGQLLDYGPVGLAAIMFIIVAATLVGTLTDRKERTLRLFMYIATFCFVISVAAQFFISDGRYRMAIFVAPNDLTERNHSPPVIQMNGEELDRLEHQFVDEDFQIIVDVSESISRLEAQILELDQARQRIIDQAEFLDDLEQRLRTVILNFREVEPSFSLQAPNTETLRGLNDVDRGLQSIELLLR